MRKWNYYNRIMRYLEHEMQADETAEFQKELQQNKDLKEEYDLLVLTQKASELMGKQKIREQLQNQISLPNPEKKVVRFPWIGIAASLILVLAAWFYGRQNYSNAVLAQTYLPAIQNEITRTESAELPSLSTQDMDFENGLKAIEAKEYEKAKKVFKVILDGNDTILHEKAALALAITALLSGDETECRKHIAAIQATPHFAEGTKSKAQGLLDDLDSGWRIFN